MQNSWSDYFIFLKRRVETALSFHRFIGSVANRLPNTTDRVRKPAWLRQTGLHPLPHSRITDGIPPVDQALLDERLETLQASLGVRQDKCLLGRAGQSIRQVVIGDMRSYAPVRALSGSCFE